MPQPPVRTRIAPSPTGMPHIGTVFQALINFAFAKRHGKENGQFIVRTEDTDQARKVKGAEEALFEALDWFQLTPDESVKHGGDYGPYRQSERLNIYKKYADQLVDSNHAYYCFCSQERLDRVRKQMQQDGLPPMYDGKCRTLDKTTAKKRAAQESHVVRMRVDKQGEPIVLHDRRRGKISFDRSVIDDQVLLKSDGFPTYHLAVVVDDHLMKITHVIRGEEWISSAPKHVLLAQYLGWKPQEITHTPLLRNPDKSKLSKRHGHASVSWYQEQGYLPEAILNFLATRVWNHPGGKEVFPLSEFVKLFTFQGMHIQAPVVDLQKLDWYNGMYIRDMFEKDKKKLLAYLSDPKFKPKKLSQENLVKLLPLIKDRLVKLSDITELTDFFYQDIHPVKDQLIKKSTQGEVVSQLEMTINHLSKLKSWSVAAIEKVIRSLQESKSWHKGQYFMMIRLAVTGKKATPPLFETLEVLGKLTSIARLKHARQQIQNQ